LAHSGFKDAGTDFHYLSNWNHGTTALSKLTGQFADKNSRSVSRGLGTSRTSHLADSEVFFNQGMIITYVYTKQKPNTHPNPIDY